jgi:hypothetical protein
MTSLLIGLLINDVLDTWRRRLHAVVADMHIATCSLFVWLVADGWCWFVLREKYCWLVAGGWFVVREKYCWLVADKPSEQAVDRVTNAMNRS